MDTVTRNVTELGSAERQAIEQVLGQPLAEDDQIRIHIAKATPAMVTLAAIQPPLPLPQDVWERQVRAIALDCGVSLSDAAVSSEGIYE